MLAHVRFARLADLELGEAIEYLETKSGLGLRFAREVFRVVEHAQQFPGAGTVVELKQKERPVRRYRLNPAFPYDVVAMAIEEEQLLLVLAVAHHKREPSYWLDRLK